MVKEIRVPHNYSPRDYQLEFLASPARFKGAVWHRRGGKTKTVLNQQIAKTQIKKGLYYYFLPTYRQAKQVVWDTLVKEHVPDEIVEKRNDSELTIYYRNGSIQRFVGCEDVDRHRGINPIDVVFDEFSEMDPDIWKAIISPVLAENLGTATFIFTPKGKNHAWELIQASRDDERWFWSIKPVSATKSISDDELERSKATMPEALYAQEYECSFEDGAGQFFRKVKECPVNKEIPKRPHPGHKYKMGVDLAKYQDWTVITVIDIDSMEVVLFERFNKVDWEYQKKQIALIWKLYQKPQITIDATGVGDPIVEDLQRVLTTSIEPFKFTEASRRQLLDSIAIFIEQKAIKLPDDEGLRGELESFQFTISNAGNISVRCPDGLHDDRVMSLGLALYGLSPHGNRGFVGDVTPKSGGQRVHDVVVEGYIQSSFPRFIMPEPSQQDDWRNIV